MTPSQERFALGVLVIVASVLAMACAYVIVVIKQY